MLCVTCCGNKINKIIIIKQNNENIEKKIQKKFKTKKFKKNKKKKKFSKKNFKKKLKTQILQKKNFNIFPP